jgi:hypothetical protein
MARGSVDIVMRISEDLDQLLGGSVVAAHNEVARRHGRVFFGKVGRRIASSRLAVLRQNLSERRRARLMLVQRAGEDFRVFSAPLLGISPEGQIPNSQFIPPGCHDFISEVGMWLEIGEIKEIGANELHDMVLLSNARPVMDVMVECRTAMMLVTRGAGR